MRGIPKTRVGVNYYINHFEVLSSITVSVSTALLLTFTRKISQDACHVIRRFAVGFWCASFRAI